VKRVSGGLPDRRSRRQSRSVSQAAAPATPAGTDPVGASTPWVSSRLEMKSRTRPLAVVTK